MEISTSSIPRFKPMDVRNFKSLLDSVKMEPDMFYVSLASLSMFGYDVKADKRTYLTDNPSDAGKGIDISNPSNKTLNHVCVDGGLVTYGKPDYIGDGEPHGRFDCMLFTDTLLLLVEYKMDSTTEVDKNKWKLFSGGMNQIRDYYLHLKELIKVSGDSISNYFADDSIIPFVCMSNQPKMNPRINAQRLTEMEKFRMDTGLKIRYGTSITI